GVGREEAREVAARRPGGGPHRHRAHGDDDAGDDHRHPNAAGPSHAAPPKYASANAASISLGSPIVWMRPWVITAATSATLSAMRANCSTISSEMPCAASSATLS